MAKLLSVLAMLLLVVPAGAQATCAPLHPIAATSHEDLAAPQHCAMHCCDRHDDGVARQHLLSHCEQAVAETASAAFIRDEAQVHSSLQRIAVIDKWPAGHHAQEHRPPGCAAFGRTAVPVMFLPLRM